jgi:hypothetical protein
MTIIHVTKRDISHGVAGSCHECPVALAVTRTLGVHGGVNVTPKAIKAGGRVYRTPQSVVRFIRRFDSGDPVAGFGFRLQEVAR